MDILELGKEKIFGFVYMVSEVKDLIKVNFFYVYLFILVYFFCCVICYFVLVN